MEIFFPSSMKYRPQIFAGYVHPLDFLRSVALPELANVQIFNNPVSKNTFLSYLSTEILHSKKQIFVL